MAMPWQITLPKAVIDHIRNARRGHAYRRPFSGADRDDGKSYRRTNLYCEWCGLGLNEFRETGVPCPKTTRQQ